jgi:hydroxyacylglutathione hydrolase
VPADLLTPVVDPGLGNTAYLVDLGDGRGLAVDACRDLRALRRAAERRNVRIAFAADTHLHADFLSGAVQLRADEGAEILASRAGGREFPHRALGDGDEADLGGLTLRALATPGHTDEHLSFLLLDGARPLGVFSGGSLIAGSAARVDLVAPERTQELARKQHASLRRLAALPPETELWPTHGGGSFCSTAARGGGTSSIGAELASNPLLAARDEDEFVGRLIATLGSYPAYFDRLGEVNRRGPGVLRAMPTIPPLTPEEAVRLASDGAIVVDVRPIEAFSTSHPPGALSIPLRPAFASWLGWLVPEDRRIVVLRGEDQDVVDLVWQATKIGYDIDGEIAGGIEAWRAAGLPTASVPLVTPEEVGGRQILDIRQAGEFDAGHLTGAAHVELGSLVHHTPALDDRSIVVMCGHGERAMSAASILAPRGVTNISVLHGGPAELAAARREQLATG